MNKLNNEKHFLFKIPSTISLSTSKGKERLKEQIYNTEENKLLKKILILIYIKLNSKNPNYAWTLDDYKTFKKSFSNRDNKQMNIIDTSIIKCLRAPSLEIYKELQSFSTQVDWYPEQDRIKDKDTYIYKNKEIKSIDCFYIINTLMMRMYQHVNQYSRKIVQQYEPTVEDIKIIIDEIKENFIQEFDNKYQFIMEYPLFLDVYLKFRQESIEILTQNIRKITAQIIKRKEKSPKWGCRYNCTKSYYFTKSI